MNVTLEQVRKTLSPEKLERIGFRDTIEGMSEGKTIQDMLEISDAMVEKFYEISLEYLHQKRYDEASDCFLFLSSLNPFDSRFWIKGGNAEHFLGRYPEALEAYSMAMLCDADNPFPHFYSAQVYFALHQNKEANECLHICSELMKEHIENYAGLEEHITNLQAAIKKK